MSELYFYLFLSILSLILLISALLAAESNWIAFVTFSINMLILPLWLAKVIQYTKQLKSE